MPGAALRRPREDEARGRGTGGCAAAPPSRRVLRIVRDTTSWIKAADEIAAQRPTHRRRHATPDSPLPRRFRRAGFSRGQGSVINLAGRKAGRYGAGPVGRAIHRAWRRARFGGGFPSSLMGTIAYIRQIYLDADHYNW